LLALELKRVLMASDQQELEAQLNAINSALGKLESRLDVLHQEFQRTSAVVNRLKLSQDGGKPAALRQEEVLADLKTQLDRIEKYLKAR